MSFSCQKGKFDRCFNRLDRPVEESRPDRQSDRPVDSTSAGWPDRFPSLDQILRKSQLKTTKKTNAVKVGSKTITEPRQICNKLNEYFLTDGEKLGFKSTSSKNTNYLKFLGKRQVPFILLRPTDEYEVIKTIAGLKDNKCACYIDICITLINSRNNLNQHKISQFI